MPAILRALSFLNHVPARQDPGPMIERAAGWGLDVIVSQGTGKDFGPHMLGTGTQFPIRNFKENVRPYVRAARQLDIPYILSVGIAGAHEQLDECVTAFDEMCAEERIDTEVAIINGDVDSELILRYLSAGVRMPRMDDHDALSEYLTDEDVHASTNIVAQMGPEPIMAALDSGVDGVITGRALDVGLFMAPAIRAGADKAVAALFGKLMECCGVALYPGDPGVPIYGEIHDDGSIIIRSPDDASECRLRNLAAHSFYERKNPFREENPGGYLDLDDVTYEQLDSHSVRVVGPTWTDTPYTVKLEGAAFTGYRAINIAGVREPRYLEVFPEVVERVKTEIRESDRFTDLEEGEDYHLTVTTYGRDAVLGPTEHDLGTAHEYGLLIDAVAATRELARELCYTAYLSFWIRPYPGRKTTAGNNAQRFTEPILDAGELYRWSIWHLMPLDDPCAPFRSRTVHLPSGGGDR